MISLNRNTIKGREGANGEYVKLSSQIGIKLIHSKLFTTQTKAMKSTAWKLAMGESENLKLAFDSGVVPQSYGVSLVKVGSGFRVGVLMQHLGGTTLDNSEFYDDVDVYEHLRDKLKEVGIKHFDLHGDNIMVYRGKCYAIDFSPQCIEYK